MKILIVTPRVPFPPYRGDKLKIFNLSRELQKKNEIKILTFFAKESELHDINELRKLNYDIEGISLPRIKSLFSMIISFFNNAPFQINYYRSKKMSKKIHELTGSNGYDAVYFHLINSAQYYTAIKNPETLKILDFTDATSLYLTRYVDFLKNPFRKIFFISELKRIMNYEKVALHFDTLFVCSLVDKKFLEERNIHDNIRLLLNGFDADSFNFQPLKPQRGRIIFSGNMTYFPNIDAVKYFVEEIFPLVLAKIPDAVFYIVGQQPPREISELQNENIKVTGFVRDIRKEYLQSEVNIAPIRFGSGTLNKIIEAVALGVPTVATTLSVQGFPENLKKFIFTADSKEAFAGMIIDILNDSSVRENLLKEGTPEIRNSLSWNRIVNDLEEYLKLRVAHHKENSPC